MKRSRQPLVCRWFLLASLILTFTGLSAQTPVIHLSVSSLDFGTQNVGTTSVVQSALVSNIGTAAATLSGIVLSGNFSGDFIASNDCGASIAAGASCSIRVSFAPTGTGLRAASVLVIDNAVNSPQTIPLFGTGTGGCSSISDCAYRELNRRATANQSSFYVYKDADSAFNHGFPSGLFGSRDVNLSTVKLDSACIDDPITGCSADANRLDGTRGNVFAITFPSFSQPPLGPDDFAGLNFVEPQNYDGITVIGNGYDLSGATAVQFDVRSPDGARVQFGVGGCVTGFFTLASTWTTFTILLNTFFPPSGGAFPCPPDLSSAHILFTVTTNGAQMANGGTVLLDNIQFTPVPVRQTKDLLALSLPLGNQTFGVLRRDTKPFPTDQANRNPATIYEAALTILSLFDRGQPTDIASALKIADALDYALHHDNHGDPLPVAPDGSVGLHNAYEAGDIALLNDQPSQGVAATALAGDVRIAGFSISQGTALCGPTAFCLLEDGATGGNNAFAILALAATYLQSGKLVYLTDAETIGNWITGTLTDPVPLTSSFGGYFAQFDDLPLHPLNHGKSTENNADIFATFSLLAQIEAARGNGVAAAGWTAKANIAGDFVMQMFDSASGRFFVGTVPVAAGPGSCGPGTIKGNDEINPCDFLDADSFTTLAMAASSRYGSLIDWSRPIQYVLNLAPASFTQSVTADGITFQGFDIVPAAPATGIAWEFTGQMAEACNYLDSILKVITFQTCGQTYASQTLSAQNSAPFGNGLGVVASTMQNGDALTPVNQCLQTPFQCIPERTGLAATNWAIYADRKFNPLAFASASFSPASVTFSSQLVGVTAAPVPVTLTNLGIIFLTLTSPVTITGVNSGDFAIGSNTCLSGTVLAPGGSCALSVTFTPSAGGLRAAALTFNDTAIGTPQAVSLSGTGLPLDDFSMAVAPATQTVVAGGTTSYTVSTSITRGNTQNITLSVPDLPAGVTSSFAPTQIVSGGTSILTIRADVGALPVSKGITITGTGVSAVRTVQAVLTIQPPVGLSPALLTFAQQVIATTSAPQSVIVSNGSAVTSTLKSIVLSGSFSGDFAQTNTCSMAIAPGASCTISVTFTPSRTGARAATLLVFDDAGNSPQVVVLSGSGKAACSSISGCAYNDLDQRVSANQKAFYVYKDADSGFNHGFPSGLFGSQSFDLSTVIIDSGCLDDPASSTGCSSGPNRLDGTRGTVFRITFPSIPVGQFVGLNFQEPESGAAVNFYNLTPATAVQFDVRSPDSAKVRFGVGGCVTNPIQLSPSWTTLTIQISTLVSGSICPPDLAHTNLLFAVQADDVNSPNGAKVLLDNIQFLPVPARQSTAPSLPVGTLTLGVVPSKNSPVPIDQATRNLSTVYESALTILSLLKRGQSTDLGFARAVADALDYALHHDNHGDLLPALPDGSAGLHDAYSSGDLALLNGQAPKGAALAGDVRLAGFFASTSLCGDTAFCLVLDGASGGSNTWAILAFAAAYLQTGNLTYLADAESIGEWINSELGDPAAISLGGYFVGFTDGGLPKVLILGKSTEFNADIFAAFSLLAQIEASRGNTATAATWTARANVAGDFVAQMFDPVKGRFFAGTVSSDIAGTTGPGICANGAQRGNDVINTCDFLDANSFPTLAMAASARFQSIDWTRPLTYILSLPPPNSFTQSVVADGITFQGFGVVPSPPATGVAWEFTAQTAETCNYLDALLNVVSFQTCGQTYVAQLLQAQNLAPFGNGLGVTGSVLEAGDTLPPLSQCLNTPFQCVPERPALAATNWAIYAEQKFNPFAFASVSLSTSALTFAGQPLNTSSAPMSVIVNNGGTGTLKVAAVTITGPATAEFIKTGDTCSVALVLGGSSCAIAIAFKPTATGNRVATLAIADNALGSSHLVSLSGLGTASAASLSATTLDFMTVLIGGQVAKDITLTNSGTTSLNISSIAINGVDYTQTSSCGTLVAVNASCLIHVTFTPSSFVGAGAALIITDDAPDSPQSVALKGTGATYLLHVAAGAPNSLQVTAGQTANYTLTLESSSQRDIVTLSCIAAIPKGACNVSPNQAQLPVASPITVMVLVSTTANASAFGSHKTWHLTPLNVPAMYLLAIGLWALLLRRSARRGMHPKPVHAAFILIALCMAVLMLSCGGGGGLGPPPPPPPVVGTPAGTYNLTVNATSSANSPPQPVQLTMQVK